MESDFLKLNLRDFIHGLLMAILAPIVGVIQSSLENGVLTFDWRQIGLLSLSGGFAYLVKKFLSGTKNEQ